MFSSFIFLVLFVSIITALTNIPITHQNDHESMRVGWTLYWQDEFNGTTLDTTKWRYFSFLNPFIYSFRYTLSLYSLLLYRSILFSILSFTLPLFLFLTHPYLSTLTQPSPRNNELEYYTAEDVYVTGGNLVLRSQKRDYEV